MPPASSTRARPRVFLCPEPPVAASTIPITTAATATAAITILFRLPGIVGSPAGAHYSATPGSSPVWIRPRRRSPTPDLPGARAAVVEGWPVMERQSLVVLPPELTHEAPRAPGGLPAGHRRWGHEDAGRGPRDRVRQGPRRPRGAEQRGRDRSRGGGSRAAQRRRGGDGRGRASPSRTSAQPCWRSRGPTPPRSPSTCAARTRGVDRRQRRGRCLGRGHRGRRRRGGDRRHGLERLRGRSRRARGAPAAGGTCSVTRAAPTGSAWSRSGPPCATARRRDPRRR